MASLHKQFRRDVDVAWITIAPNVQIKSRLLDTRSTAWTKVYNKLALPVRKELQFGELDAKRERELLVRTFVEVCVTDWRTKVKETEYRPEVEVTDGKWSKYTSELAIQVFCDYPQLYTSAVEGTAELANFQLSEAELKNLQTV